MENKNDSENKQTELFDNMSNDEREALSKIGNIIIDTVEKNKSSDEKFQNNLNAELKKINPSRDLQAYTNGLEKGLHEGKKEGFWKGVATGGSALSIIALGYYLYTKNKKS